MWQAKKLNLGYYRAPLPKTNKKVYEVEPESTTVAWTVSPTAKLPNGADVYFKSQTIDLSPSGYTETNDSVFVQRDKIGPTLTERYDFMKDQLELSITCWGQTATLGPGPQFLTVFHQLLNNWGLHDFPQDVISVLGKRYQSEPTESPEELSKEISGIRQSARCPISSHRNDPLRAPIDLWGVIIHLNDYHKWTREQIADWLDERDGLDFDCPRFDLALPAPV